MTQPKVVLLCRDGVEAQYLAHQLHDAGRLDAVIVETGAAARQRKLDRMLQQGNAVARVGKLLDVIAVYLYSRIVQAWLRRYVLGPLGISGYPAGLPHTVVDDANEPACVQRLTELAPDIVVVLGTAILREPVLSLDIPHVLNVHGGVVPAYRNVHSDVWALLRGDAERIGTSILHLDAGVDTGDVALIGTVAPQPGWGILEVKRANLDLAARLTREAVERAAAGSLERTPQHGEPGFYPTPGAVQLARLLTARV